MINRALFNFLICAFLFLGLAPFASAQNAVEPIDEEAVELIKNEGLENSHVMNYMSWMTDVFGGRLTGSPALNSATDWAMEALSELGLQNVQKEAWGPFGRGWTVEHMNIQASTPHGGFLVTAYPKAWTPGTDGHVSGQVVHVSASSIEDLEQYRGKLSDKIVLVQEIRDLEEPFGPTANRLNDERLLSMANAVPGAGGGSRRYNAGEWRTAENVSAGRSTKCADGFVIEIDVFETETTVRSEYRLR